MITNLSSSNNLNNQKEWFPLRQWLIDVMCEQPHICIQPRQKEILCWMSFFVDYSVHISIKNPNNYLEPSKFWNCTIKRIIQKKGLKKGIWRNDFNNRKRLPHTHCQMDNSWPLLKLSLQWYAGWQTASFLPYFRYNMFDVYVDEILYQSMVRPFECLIKRYFQKAKKKFYSELSTETNCNTTITLLNERVKCSTLTYFAAIPNRVTSANTIQVL